MTAKPGSALSPEAQALVAEERAIPAHEEAVRVRVMSRAEEAVRLGPPVPHPLGAPPAGVSKGLLATALGIALVGGIATVVYLTTSGGPRTPPATVAPPQPASAVALAPTAGTPAPVNRAEPPPASDTQPATRAPEEPTAAGPRPSASSRQDRGVEELALLSRARKADARGDFSEVLALASEHERTFPAGRLAEEREVLRVRALVGLGRTDQARRAAARFRRQFPRSVLLHKIDEMVP